MKLATIVGARPQFVKAAVVSRALSRAGQITESIIHTGQHYDANMSDIFFEQMEIPKPHLNLDIGSGGHGAQTGRMLEAIEKSLIELKPDWVLVYGDTNSTLAGSLAAAKLHIPVAHVEAGIRSFNWQMPEEVNRVLTDRLSALLFCPTSVAIENLTAEAIPPIRLRQVGDVMYDAALFYSEKNGVSDMAKKLVNELGDYFICTCHRAENTDDLTRLKSIFKSLDEISAETPILLPLHPRTKKALAAASIQPKNIRIIEPVGYFDMLHFTKNSRAVITDSGGMQKEAYFFQKPGLILRDDTEWPELVTQVKTNRLVGADSEKILAGATAVMKEKFDFSTNLYGDGHSGDAIVKHLWGSL